jgi:hypothetical protein
MGDPSIMNYFGVPDPLTVSYSSSIVIGETSLTVNTEPYAYVAISQNNVLLDAQYTGTNSSVTLTFPSFTNTGTADIVVTKQNKQPHIGTIDIINGNTNDDALVSSIISPLTTYNCSGITVPAKLEIKNLGQNNITSLDINYVFDGGSVVTQTWSGNLASLETDTVTLQNITLTAGNHTFVAYTSNPNGNQDENPDNDTASIDINVQDNPTVSDFSADITEEANVEEAAVNDEQQVEEVNNTNTTQN